jgi:radical SAM protein with 4Fe4S-binding SPASM domain
MQSQPYNDFWQKLHQSARITGFPVRVMFELTYRCNFKCKHCYVPHKYRFKYGELNTKGVFKVLDQLKDAGCFYLGFTGGEPFMRKDALKIFEYARKKGFEVIIYSNGSLINNRIARELGRLRLNKVDITIPGMSRGVFENITGLKGSHVKVFKAIKLLQKNKVPLGFKSCVLKDNEREIVKIQEFTQSLGALHRVDDMLSARLDGSKEPFEYKSRLGQDAKEPDNCEIARDVPIEKNLFKCGVGQSQAAITPNGELKMCLMIDYPKYKILDSSFKSSWLKMKKLIGKIKPDKYYKCSQCSLELYCKWCPAKGWLESGRFTACDVNSRRYAQLLKNRLKV